MKNVKTLLDLRELLFSFQKRKEKYLGLSTFKKHMDHYLDFDFDIDFEYFRDSTIARFNFATEKGNEIFVQVKLCIYSEYYQFTSFEIKALKHFDYNKQNKMMLQSY